MDSRLEIEKTSSTPYVLLDGEKGYIKMEGRCYHENIATFFKEINDWLDDYLKTDFGTLTFDNSISYLNSSTTKLLLTMLLKMDKHSTGKNKVIVNWIASKQNDIMLEFGEDLLEDMENLTFNIVVEK